MLKEILALEQTSLTWAGKTLLLMDGNITLRDWGPPSLTGCISSVGTIQKEGGKFVFSKVQLYLKSPSVKPPSCLCYPSIALQPIMCLSCSREQHHFPIPTASNPNSRVLPLLTPLHTAIFSGQACLATSPSTTHSGAGLRS